jgi:hypothetical protein
MKNYPYGFRIVGSTYEARRSVNASAAFAGYAACDDRAEVQREAYLSAFQFGEDFRQLLIETGSTAGFAGPCWSPWIWFDIDAENDLGRAHRDAGRLAMVLYERYKPGDDDMLIFFSGSKGFHIGLPTSLWLPNPSDDFHKTARKFAEYAAELADVAIDAGVYDKVRAFRAPNSRHPKTSLHKRYFGLDELTGLSLERIEELSREPAPFDIPETSRRSEQAAADWQTAANSVTRETEAKQQRRINNIGTPSLNRATLDFIREGAALGDRHRLLFSAAANLAEFNCPPALACALLEESALDSGLPPKDVRRQIECGIMAVASSSLNVEPSATPSIESEELLNAPTMANIDVAQAVPVSNPDLQSALAQLWESAPTSVKKTETREIKPMPSNNDGSTIFPLDPPRIIPLPPGAIGAGTIDKPCRCGSKEYADIEIEPGKIRRDCRKCGKFIEWAEWSTNEGEAL